jgi:hypothetical protein
MDSKYISHEINRENLHWLIDKLPECEVEVTYWVVLAHLKQHDPFIWKLMTAPYDDEVEESEEQRLATEEAEEDMRAGRWSTLEDVKQRLGIPR